MKWNGNYSFYSYIQLERGSPFKELEKKLPDLMWDNLNKNYTDFGYKEILYLQPLKGLHLDSPGLKLKVLALSIVALLILLLACFNFINLSTAIASRRILEMGIRKTNGAGNRTLRFQFLFESILIVIIGLFISLVLAESLLPVYNKILGTQLRLNLLTSPLIFLVFIITGILIGLLSGIYPAFYMTSLDPVKTIKGRVVNGRSGKIFENILTIIQFVISIALIIFIGIVYRQINYMRTKKLGYNKENILYITLRNREVSKKYLLLEEMFKNIPSVKDVAAGSAVPGYGFTSNGYIPEGSDKPLMFNALEADYNFIPTLGIQLKEGRNFSRQYPTDEKDACLINETLVRQLRWKAPVGKIIERNGVNNKVIGVIHDYFGASLHQQIQPLIITMRPYRGFYYLFVRIDGKNITSTLNQMQKEWKKMAGFLPFDYHFLDDTFDELYRDDIRFGIIFLIFTVIAIFIAGIGLFSLTLFSTQTKTKEIGIRKVNGAKTGEIMLMLTVNFTKWVIISFIIACPLAFYALISGCKILLIRQI